MVVFELCREETSNLSTFDTAYEFIGAKHFPPMVLEVRASVARSVLQILPIEHISPAQSERLSQLACRQRVHDNDALGRCERMAFAMERASRYQLVDISDPSISISWTGLTTMR